MKTININDIIKQKDQSIIIDVRTPFEFESIHMKDSYNLPLDKLESQIEKLESLDQQVFFICKSGARSSQACKRLETSHKKNFYVIEGGIDSIKNYPQELVKGKNKWDLSRQVRFTAGSLVLTGMILGTWVNSNLYLISTFVGAGLVFSAVTNTCMMGTLLAKMPFNKTKSKVKRFEDLF